MGRNKVFLKYITHKETRRETLDRRSKTLMKKAREVAIMCKTKACVIVYPEGESAPEVFSSQSHNETMAILNRLTSMEDGHRFNKKMDQECFLKKQLDQLQKQALQSRRDREESELKLLIHKAMVEGHAGLSMEEHAKVDCKVEVLLKSIDDRITNITGQPPVYLPSQAHTPTPGIIGDVNIIGASTMYQAQAQTPNLIDDMVAIGAPTMYMSQGPTSNAIGGMETIGDRTVYKAQAPTPYVPTGGMNAVGASTMYQDRAPPQPQDEWLELMRTGGGDLDGVGCSDFNGGASLSSTTGLNGNGMVQPLDMGSWFGHPWSSVDPGPSSNAFPPV